MGRSLVAVDLGGSDIRAVQFKVAKGGPALTKAGRIATPEGAIVNGEVKNVDAVAGALKTLWQQQKFSTKQVVFAVANEQVLVRIMSLPWDNDEHFRQGLKFRDEVSDALPFEAEAANLDFHTLYEHQVPREDGFGHVRHKAILLVASQAAMVDQFVKAFRAAGLAPVACDLGAFALVRSVYQGEPFEADAVEAIIDMGQDMTQMVMHQGGQPLFVRMVQDQGGRAVTQKVSERMDWPWEQAEQAKRDMGLTGGLAVDGTQHMAQRTINAVVSQSIAEIRQSIDFLLANTENVGRVSRVVLTGGGAHLRGVADRLASELRVPVVLATPLTQAGSVVVPEDSAESQFAVVCGLAKGAY